MPKDQRRAPRLHNDHNQVAAASQPRRHRQLPGDLRGFLDRYRERNGEAFPWTNANLVRATTYEFKLPPRPHPSAGFSFSRKQAEERREQSRVSRTAAEEARALSLAERLEQRPPPSLAQRISAANAAATYDPIAPTTSLIDFEKTKVEDLIGIFRPKIRATRTRLRPIGELDLSEQNSACVRAYHNLVDKLEALDKNLLIRAPHLSPKEWQSINWGLKGIGEIPFRGLRRNLRVILASIEAVYAFGYFDQVAC